jgi:hypothetical protein
VGVRTTVTLDPDVERLLRQAMNAKGVSFKEALNQAIRTGLSARRKSQPRFVQQTFHMGSEQLFRWDKALATAEALEDEEYNRKLALRK